VEFAPTGKPILPRLPLDSIRVQDTMGSALPTLEGSTDADSDSDTWDMASSCSAASRDPRWGPPGSGLPRLDSWDSGVAGPCRGRGSPRRRGRRQPTGRTLQPLLLAEEVDLETFSAWLSELEAGERRLRADLEAEAEASGQAGAAAATATPRAGGPALPEDPARPDCPLERQAASLCDLEEEEEEEEEQPQGPKEGPPEQAEAAAGRPAAEPRDLLSPALPKAVQARDTLQCMARFLGRVARWGASDSGASPANPAR